MKHKQILVQALILIALLFLAHNVFLSYLDYSTNVSIQRVLRALAAQ